MALILHEIVASTREVFNNEGWAGLIPRMLRKIRHILLVTNDANWYARDLDKEIQGPVSRLPVRFDRSNKEETIAWLRENHDRFSWMYIPEEICVARSCDHYLPTVRLDNKIIGYIKIAREKAYVLDYGTELDLPPGEAFVYDTFVLPEYRGKKIASFLIAESMAFLRQEGYRRLWCHIPGWNVASISAFRRAGFRKVGHIRFFRILGRGIFSVHPEYLVRRTASGHPRGPYRYTISGVM